MDNGWIKLHRKMIEWEWYQNANVFRVFMHCFLSANHKDKKWQGIEIKRGSFITSYKHLSDELSSKHSKISIQSVRTALNKLFLTGELTIKTTNKYSLIKVNNWDKYQVANTQPNKQLTNKQQTTNKQLTTTKNDKNDKNDKKREKKFIPPSLKELNKYILNKNLAVNGEQFIDFYLSKGWKIGNSSMKDWKATVRNWARRENKDITEKRGKKDISERRII